jgi:methionyl-tRNA formyltransferase
MTPRYLVAGIGPWSRTAFTAMIDDLPAHQREQWALYDTPRGLQAGVRRYLPQYVFLPHWRWRVQDEVLQKTTCVGFHMTALPWGKGGSPLQHLIQLRRRDTTLTAYRMTADFDGGPIYSATLLSLDGSAGEIYQRAAHISIRMARLIAYTPQMTPRPQRATRETDKVFKRRQPSESELILEPHLTAKDLYDFVRMLDADGYQRAFRDHGRWRLEFSKARRDGQTVEATVRFTRRKA